MDRPMNRRRMLAASASSVAMGVSSKWLPAWAQGTGDRPSQRLLALEEKARGVGVPIPPPDRSRVLSAADQDSYIEVMPRLVGLIDQANATGRPGAEVEEEAAEFLAQIHAAERGGIAQDDITRRPAPAFDMLKDEYRTLFDKCEVRNQYKSKVDGLIAILKSHKPRYEEVGKRLGGIPWYFIGGIHSLEAGFNFKAHFHNGDYPLAKRTVNEPKGQPVMWNPPSDWESSAEDAIRAKGYDKQPEWALEQMLYRWERYNGFGYRGKINSPYLWSFSNNYASGKYVRDGVWDASATSQQCGTAVLLKGLIAAGEVSL
jgi:lysozyme family protein